MVLIADSAVDGTFTKMIFAALRVRIVTIHYAAS